MFIYELNYDKIIYILIVILDWSKWAVELIDFRVLNYILYKVVEVFKLILIYYKKLI